MFYAFSDKLPHRGIPVSGLVESVSAPILRLLFPGTDEEYDEKVQLLTDVSELEKEEQTKKEVEIEKKKKQKWKRQRKLGRGLNPRKNENVVGM